MKTKVNFFKIIVIGVFLILLVSLSSAQSAYGQAIKKELYEISRSKVERLITERDIFKDSFTIKNFDEVQKTVSVFSSETISDIIDIESTGVVVSPKNQSDVFFTITGKELENYIGEIIISGDISEKINVNISVVNRSLNYEFYVSLKTFKKVFTFDDNLDFKIDVQKVTEDSIENVSFSYYIKSLDDNSSHFIGTEKKDLIGSLQIRKNLGFPEELVEGYYILDVLTEYKNRTALASAEFQLKKGFWSITLFGFLPIWLLTSIIAFFTILITSFVFVRKAIAKRKKYRMQLYTKTLPKKTERSFLLGKIAEKNSPAFLDMDALTTHAVVAGATGGGKSISAQVIIEEALLKKIAVIVFDPTAQWSGMLRKCDDKKMLSFYPKFGLKPGDAKAFPGNLRQIKNERQAIDVKKYMNPGQIQIFALNKLTPPQIDTFVASVIAAIFKSDPKEHPELRVMLVFDEVHRLLPKFGGSGKGFLQIERACREFRKWGFGVMLVSQVLSDFVGEIKANINTEVQMRTRDESDLNRLKTKYGEEFLQSLIKASVGVGMFVNPKYNKGKPYFVNFRPILHNTRRLSDKVLEQYNSYSEVIEDLEYQIEQLEQNKVDVFDLKMELKLVKDKLMSGNFTVVDIYLEGLKSRLEKQWSSIGKKPKKKELELIAEEEVEASLKKAEKGREKFEKKQEGEDEDKEDKDVKKKEESEKDKKEDKKLKKKDGKKDTESNKEKAGEDKRAKKQSKSKESKVSKKAKGKK